MSFEIKNLPNLSLFPQFKYEKYEGKATYHGKTCYVLTGRTPSTILERVVFTIKALALTILSCGIALLFSQVRELWTNAFFATRQIQAYGNEEQLSDSIKLAIYNSWNTSDSKPLFLNTKLTKEDALKLLETEIIDFEELPVHLKHDASFVLELIKQQDSNILYIAFMPTSNPLLNNEDFLLELIKIDPCFILKASQELINNEKFLSNAIQIKADIKKYIPLPQAYADNRKLIKEWMSERVDTFNHISETLKKNKSFIKELTVIRPVLDEYLIYQDSNSNDEDELLSFIERDPTILNLLSEPLLSNRSFLIKAAQSHKSQTHTISFQHLPLRFKNDLDFVLELIDHLPPNQLSQFLKVLIIENNPCVNSVVIEKIINQSKEIPPLPYQLRNNRDFLLKILNIPQLTKDGCGPLPKKFANDEEIILKWIASGVSDEDLRNISSTLKQNPQFIEKATKRHPGFSACLKTDIVYNGNEDQALELIRQNPRLIHSLSPKRKGNKEFLIQCLKKNWDVMTHITNDLLDEELIWKIFEQIGKFHNRLCRDLPMFKDEKRVFELIKLMETRDDRSFEFQGLMRHIAPTITTSKKCFIQALNINEFKDHIDTFPWYGPSQELKNDPEVVLALLAHNVLREIPDALKDDPGIVLAKLKKYPDFVFELLSTNSNLLKNIDFLLETTKLDLTHRIDISNISVTHPQDFKKLKDLSLAYIEKNAQAALPQDIRSNRDFWLSVSHDTCSRIHYIPSDNIAKDPEVMLHILKKNPGRLYLVDDELRRNPDFKAKWDKLMQSSEEA